MQQQDNLVLWLILVTFIILLGRYLYLRYLRLMPHEKINSNDQVVQMLESQGYTTIQQKVRVPIKIKKEEKEIFESRYYIDAIARKDGFTYAVKLSRARKQLDMTGPSIRDQLLPIYLLGSWDGILYIDIDQEKILLFTFNLDTNFIPKKRVFLPYLLFFILGVIITLLLT